MKKIFKYLNLFIVSTLIMISGTLVVNAASASINIISGTSRIVVGKEFTVTIKISSGGLLGSWEFTPSYDSKKLKLLSDGSHVVDFGDGKIKSKSYTYKFKAIGTGSSNISVKSAGALAWDESKLSLSIGSKTIKVITQAELEASYSKVNTLKSLSVDGLELSPSFKSDTLNYTANADSNTTSVNVKCSVTDSKASVSGCGNHDVSEGDNKINIVVTAENGSTRTYTVTINVTDPNPIEVEIDNNKYVVVKRESNLECPSDYEKKEITINDQKIPAFYNELNNFTLVGLKNSDGDIKLFLYDEKNNKYSFYSEVKLNQIKIYPLDIDKDFGSTYKKTNVKINDIEFQAMKTDNSNYSIVHARNLGDGKNDYYIYDEKLNTLITYSSEFENLYKEKSDSYKKIIFILLAESCVVVLILICMLFSKIKKDKKRKKIMIDIEKDIKKNKEDERIKKEKKEKNNKKDKDKKKNKEEDQELEKDDE